MVDASENYYDNFIDLSYRVSILAEEVTAQLYKIREEEADEGVPVDKMTAGLSRPNKSISTSLELVHDLLKSADYAKVKACAMAKRFKICLEIEPIVGAFREEDFSSQVKCLAHLSSVPQIRYDNPDCRLILIVEHMA